MALIIRIRTMACLRFCRKNSGVATPIFAKNAITKGSSKTTPKEKINVPTKSVVCQCISEVDAPLYLQREANDFVPHGFSLMDPLT